MLPYFLLLLFTAFFPLFFYQTGRTALVYNYTGIVQKRNRMTILIFFFGLFILLSLRDISVGTDLGTYKSIYEICCYNSIEQLSELQWELGYTIYNRIVSFVSNDFRIFLIVTAAITLLPIYKLYSQEKRFSYLIIVLFINMPCFLMLFSGLRQAIAISIGVLVYMSIEKKRYFLGGVLIFLAMSFHTSAFVLVLLYPAVFFKTKTRHLIYIIPILCVVFMYRNQVLLYIIGNLPNKYVEFYGETQQTGAFGMMILFLLFIIFSFVILDEENMSDRDYFMRNILMFATIIQLFVPIHGLVQRASYYFLVFVPITLVSVVSAPKKRMKNISNLAVIVMCMFFTGYFFYTAFFSTDNLLDVFPYKFYWSS